MIVLQITKIYGYLARIDIYIEIGMENTIKFSLTEDNKYVINVDKNLYRITSKVINNRTIPKKTFRFNINHHHQAVFALFPE